MKKAETKETFLRNYSFYSKVDAFIYIKIPWINIYYYPIKTKISKAIVYFRTTIKSSQSKLLFTKSYVLTLIQSSIVKNFIK